MHSGIYTVNWINFSPPINNSKSNRVVFLSQAGGGCCVPVECLEKPALVPAYVFWCEHCICFYRLSCSTARSSDFKVASDCWRRCDGWNTQLGCPSCFVWGRGAVVAKNPKSDRDQTGEDVQTGVVGRRLIQEVCNMLCLSKWWDHILFGFPHNDLCWAAHRN